MAKLTKTSTPGIFRRHKKDCGGGRCDCAYVVMWRHRGRQHKETFRTLAEAREAQGKRRAGDGISFVEGHGRRLLLGVDRDLRGADFAGPVGAIRSLYHRAISERVIPEWGTWRLGEVEPVDVRRLYGKLREAEVSTSVLRLIRAATSAMFATAVEDGILRTSPVAGVRIPAPKVTGEDDEPAKALTKEELRLILRAVG